jgi:hypothetical protein
MTMFRRPLQLIAGLLLPALGSADTLVHWGELSGVTPGNTNIVTANQNFVGATSTYTGTTNNPAVGASLLPGGLRSVALVLGGVQRHRRPASPKTPPRATG